MFELMFSLMAQIKSKSCNKFDSFLTMTVAGKILKWSHELKDIFFKVDPGSRLFHSVITVGEKVFEKNMLCVEKRNGIHISCSIWCTFYRNDIKKVFRVFIFEIFLKNTRFS